MEDREALLESFRGRLAEFKTRMEQQRSRVGRITSRNAADFDEQMTNLRKEMEQACTQVELLSDSCGGEWKSLKKSFEAAWEELREAFETASTRF